jgi:hypothetical protein
MCSNYLQIKSHQKDKNIHICHTHGRLCVIAISILKRGAIQNVAPVLGSAFGKFQIPLLTWLQFTDNQ